VIDWSDQQNPTISRSCKIERRRLTWLRVASFIFSISLYVALLTGLAKGDSAQAVDGSAYFIPPRPRVIAYESVVCVSQGVRELGRTKGTI